MDDVVEVRPQRMRGVGLVAAGLLAGLVIAGLSTAGAQAPAPAPAPVAAESHEPARDEQERREDRGRRDRRMGRLGAVQHGEFVLRGRDGTFRTIAVQRGIAAAITPTSVTVRSADGYVRTYVRDAETKLADGVKTGDFVRVFAVVENGRARATHVRPGRMHDRPGGA